VHDDDERHPAIGRHVSKKSFNGRNPPADAPRPITGKGIVVWEIGPTFMSEFWLTLSAILARRSLL
jgi:hypothetical protein